MKKMLSLVLFFAAITVYSQNLSALTPAQIDSISMIKGRSGIAEGIIKSEKKKFDKGILKPIKGEGQSSIAIYKHPNSSSNRLMKADYHRNIRYEDKSSEEVYARFYYNEKRLFQVNIQEIIKSNGEDIVRDHTIDTANFEKLTNDGYLFTDNIKKWVAQVDASILDLSGQKHH